MNIPDFSRLAPQQSYLVSGAKLQQIEAILRALFTGDHVNTKGGGLFKSPGGDAGFTLRAPVYSKPSTGGGAASAQTPYLVQDASDAASAKVTVRYGTHNNLAPTSGGVALNPPYGTDIPKLTLGNAATAVYVEFDFIFDATGTITSYPGNSVKSASGLVPASSLIFSGDGSGTGSFYQTLAAVRVTPPASPGGVYKVTPSQIVFNSQTFQVCGSGIQYSVVAS